MEERIFDLQYFAEEPAAQPAEDSAQTDETTEAVTFTPEQQEYVNSLIEKRLSRERKNAESNARKKANEEAEALRLKNMSETERTAKQLADMAKEIAALKAEKTEGAMMSAARSELQTRGFNFPDTIIKHLIGSDADETKSNIDSFTTEFDKALQAAVKKAVPSSAPKGGRSSKKTITRAEIMAVQNKRERQKLISENIELFK